MTEFIENDLDPWFEYATTCGPCTKKEALVKNLISYEGRILADGNYDWTGFTDENGAACGYGIATYGDGNWLNKGRFTIEGTFWQN